MLDTEAQRKEGRRAAQLDAVAKKLNTRPRETLNWKTPAYILGSSVSMTH
jgi:IS30 family transposase